jgi:uncharacterized membrane protein YbhN (UPF0104 family)
MNLPKLGRRLAASRALRIGISAVVTIALLALVLRAIPPGELLRTLGHASPALLLLAAVAAFGFVSARAWRYRVLLGPERAHSGRIVLGITLAGWGISLVLPGPAGDGVFIWLARTRLSTPIALGAGAVLVARALDVISLLLVALITAPLAGVRLPAAADLAGLVLAAALVMALTGLFWARPRHAILALLGRVPWVGRLVARMEPALHELGGGSRPVALIVSTVAARCLTAVQYLALFAAIGHPLSFAQAWFALSIRTLLLAFPIQGLGGLGTGQLWWTGALTLLGWPLRTALPASLAVHLLDLAISLPQGAAGWLALYASRLSGFAPAGVSSASRSPATVSRSGSSRSERG